MDSYVWIQSWIVSLRSKMGVDITLEVPYLLRKVGMEAAKKRTRLKVERWECRMDRKLWICVLLSGEKLLLVEL
jgi:hypothetical protein